MDIAVGLILVTTIIIALLGLVFTSKRWGGAEVETDIQARIAHEIQEDYDTMQKLERNRPYSARDVAKRVRKGRKG